MAIGENDQSKQRRYKRVRDQFGRRWGGSFELKSGDFTGQIEYIEYQLEDARFYLPPILPPQIYLRPVKDNPNRIRIDFDAWKAEVRRANQEYAAASRKEGLRQFGEMYDPRAPIQRSVLDIVGQPPLALDIVIAAEQGNPWITGRTKTQDIRLVKFLEREVTKERDYSQLDYGKLQAGGLAEATAPVETESDDDWDNDDAAEFDLPDVITDDDRIAEVPARVPAGSLEVRMPVVPQEKPVAPRQKPRRSPEPVAGD